MTTLRKRPVVLIVRDGWGHNPHPELNFCNAVHLAKTPCNDAILTKYPNTQIHTSGEYVGLPGGVMGNSEVGHQNIGAGRIVEQEILRISRAIRTGDFFRNPALLGALRHVEKTSGRVHLLGLLSDGGVHSLVDHALALVDLCKQNHLPPDRLSFHVITDGRDTPPNSGRQFAHQLEQKLHETGVGRVASVVGRYYAMDRDNRWDRIQLAYRLLTRGSAFVLESAAHALEEYYRNPTDTNRQGDEFVAPVGISPKRRIEEWQLVKNGDAVIFFNFRGDRPRELTSAFVLNDEAWRAVKAGGFDRGRPISNLYFATMTCYEEGLSTIVAFEKPPKMRNILGEYLSALELAQFRCAESEKHPHVTYFFNDYREEPFPNEHRCEIPSPRDVSTYDQKPEMAAREVRDAVLGAIRSDAYDFVLVNLANGDMVGHTGNLEAAVRAVEVVDECVERIARAVLDKNGALVITADHGNCEQMVDPESGHPHTAHTTFDVDLIVVDDEMVGSVLSEGGCLADIAPTVLQLLGLHAPPEMTGRSLFSLAAGC